MKWKSPKKIRNIQKLRLVEPTDVLVCARVLKALPEGRLVDAICQFFKHAFMEEGRLLGYTDGMDYVLVANLLDEASACRFRENLVRNPVSDLRLCETPADAANLVKPWGLVAPMYLGHTVTARLAKDPDAVMFILQKKAERMDRYPEGDYVFHNLSPEEYRAVKDARKKSPQ